MGGSVTSASWQVTLWFHMGHVSSHSGEACCEPLYPVTSLYFTSLWTVRTCIPGADGKWTWRAVRWCDYVPGRTDRRRRSCVKSSLRYSQASTSTFTSSAASAFKFLSSFWLRLRLVKICCGLVIAPTPRQLNMAKCCGYVVLQVVQQIHI